MESLLENNYDRPMTPLTWPHGLFTSCRMVIHIDILFARFARTFIDSDLNVAEHVFLLILICLLLSESAYSVWHIHRNGQIWTKMFLFYPLLSVAMFTNGICLVSLLSDYRFLDQFTPMGWPIFWASHEMITSFAIPLLCALHLCIDRTFAISTEEFRQFLAKSIDLAQHQGFGRGSTFSAASSTNTRNGYEGI